MPRVQPGQRFGPYELISVLGKGGMGAVYLARDAAGREVALKLVLDEHGANADVRRRFDRESRLALAIVHRNVVRTYDAGVLEGKAYLACELMRGGSLQELLDRQGALPTPRALALARDVIAGLGALERVGLIHRDVKPANVLLAPDGSGKLGDLGLARSTDADREQFTRTGTVAGTPSYMAPEQIDGQKVLDIRGDLYAAGCVLHHALTGGPPFSGQQVLEVLKKHLFEPPPDVRVLAPTVPEPVARLVKELLHKDPADRPRDAATALARIEALLGPRDRELEQDAFPDTVDERALEGARPGDSFPGTIDERGPKGARPLDSFPGTIAERGPKGARSSGADSFPGTIDERALKGARPGDSFPGTIDERALKGARPTDADSFPGTIDERALAGARSDAFAGTIDWRALNVATPVAKDEQTIDERPPATAAVPPPIEQVEVVSPAAKNAPLQRAALVLGARTLFVYAQQALRLGRDGLERKDQDVCLRHRPAAGNEERARRISGQHLSVVVDAEGASLVDLGSTGGTTLDGRPIPARAPQRLGTAAHAVTVAGVLDLTVRALPRSTTPCPEVRGVGRASGLCCVVIERPRDGIEHAYALVAGRLPLALGADGAFAFPPGAAIELFTANGGLWLRGGDVRSGLCLPLGAGDRFRLGGRAIKVLALEPAQQK